MKTKTVLIVAGAGLALYLVYQRKEEKMEGSSDDFGKGYVAGWFTPGPITIVAFASLAHTHL